MDSNRCSDEVPEELADLAAAVDRLAAQDLDRLTDAARAHWILTLQRLVDRQEGFWLRELAAVDARGAAGADQGMQAASTASWLRNRLRMGAAAADSAVRTARALFRGPLTATAQALCEGEISVAHASALAHGTSDLPTHVVAETEPVLVEAARRLDPPRLRRLVDHLQRVADPEAADRQAERRHGRRGLWTATTLEGMVALQGLLEPEAGQTLLAALDPLARPTTADDPRSGDQRRADALIELARRNLEGGQLPQTGGVRPQLLVTVDLDSLLGRPGAVGGDAGWAGPLGPEACRRLACDGALTRVLVSRQPTQDHGHHPDDGLGDDHGLAARLQAAMALLPPILGGAPANPWTWAGPAGSSPPPNAPPWRCATAAVSSPTASDPWPGARATIWSTGWTAAPPTSPTWPCCAGPIIGRCMRGWQLTRGPDGRFTATPPQRTRRHPPPHRRQRVVA